MGKNCKPAKAVAASPGQDCVQQEKKAAHALTKCASGADSLRMEVARIQKQSKQSLADMKGSLATCLYEKKALGKQQQFRTFKSYVYGKLQELVKTSTIAVERERTVTSTVRKENTDLRMRLVRELVRCYVQHPAGPVSKVCCSFSTGNFL